MFTHEKLLKILKNAYIAEDFELVELLTAEELQTIAESTKQRIKAYPEDYGLTVENYFDLRFPDDVKTYILSRAINRKGRENVKNFILCPVCTRKTKVKIRDDTEIKNFPLYCTFCKNETVITIKNGAIIKEPDTEP